MLITTTLRLITLAAILIAAARPPASAQDRPFVFSLATSTQAARPQVLVDVSVGAGEAAFHGGADNGPEQRVGVQASVGRWTLVGHVGLASVEGAYHSSQQGEVLLSVLTRKPSGFALAIGGGMLHEAAGVNVALGRVILGRDAEHWTLHGNLLFQKPMATDRDAVDLIMSWGWARRLTSAFSLGVEGIGEDLEGFWDPNEAEGGARLLIGPSLRLAPPARSWHLLLAGGPMFHPSHTGRSSGAVRDLPATTRNNGYAFRTSFGVIF